jgi:hypothetical protein
MTIDGKGGQLPNTGRQFGCLLTQSVWAFGIVASMTGAGIPVIGHVLGCASLALFVFLMRASGAGSREALWLGLLSISFAFTPTTIPSAHVPSFLKAFWPWTYPPLADEVAGRCGSWIFATIDGLLIISTIWLGLMIYNPKGTPVNGGSTAILAQALEAYVRSNDMQLPNLVAWPITRLDLIPHLWNDQQALFPERAAIITNGSMSHKRVQPFDRDNRTFVIAMPPDRNSSRTIIYSNCEVRQLSDWAWRNLQRMSRMEGDC